VSLSLSTKDKDTLSFAGNLKMEGPLAIFKDFLSSDATLPVTAKLVTKSTDALDKIEPQSVTFHCVVPFHIILFSGVTLTKTTFNLELDKIDDKWAITAKLIGGLDVLNVTDDNTGTIAFDVTEQNGSLVLNATAKQIKGAFGIKTLNLEALTFNGQVGKSDSLNLTAQLVNAVSTFNFKGLVSKDTSGMIAKADTFSLDELAELFDEVSHTGLALPDFDVKFENTSIALATRDCTVDGAALQQGFTLITDVTAHSHKITASAQISSKGVVFDGTMKDIELGPVTVKKASLDFAIYSKSASKQTKFTIKGQSVIEGIDVDCAISFVKQDSGWTTLLGAELSADSFGLGNLFPTAKNTFVGELKFSKVCFIYASDAATMLLAGQSYSVKPGLQMMAEVEEIPGLTQLTGEKHIGLALSAHFGVDTNISIAMPDTRLSLGHSVTCDPFTIVIDITPEPDLALIFGMDIAIPNQSNPLHFDMKLSLSALGATGSVTMKNYWKNPFGINGVKVGPALALQIGIIYEQFVASGTPSEFGILGGLEIGDTVVQMAVDISEDPSKEVLMGK
ncbi:MAG: hypothetical protein MJK04_34045, partial [Psychrosphaera sp.]|nr:hypothetical protein [Psychrosphaera sp.]